MENLSREEKLELIALLEEKKRREFVYRYRGYYDTTATVWRSVYL